MTATTEALTQERTGTLLDVPRASAPAEKTYNASMRDRVEAYLKETGLTQRRLSTQLGVSESELSHWLRKFPKGDVEGLEAAVEDFFARVGIQETAPDVDEHFIETSVVEACRAAYEIIQRTDDFGLVIGPAGCGKTVAMEDALARKPTALGITVSRSTRYAGAVQRMVCGLIPTREHRGEDGKRKRSRKSETPWEFLLRRLGGSQRLLIVDNAHKLSGSGWEFLFDLHDKAGISVAAQGNARMEDDIKGHTDYARECNEQLYSRIGHKQVLAPKFSIPQAREICGAYIKQPGDPLVKLAHKVANGTGHLRALRKHLIRVPELMDGNTPQAEAFLEAHELLVTDTRLVSEEEA